MTMEELRKSSMTTNKQKKMRVSLKSPSSTPPTSFWSLPYDVVLDCLARISRSYYPTLSLVSKTFRPLLASPDLDATRSRIGKTEKCLYVCLDFHNNPSWFTFGPKQKLQAIPSLPYQHFKYSTVVSFGSEIYIIGGNVERKDIRRVLVLDCRSHQWRQLPEMREPRREAAADVIDGKICVFGGCEIKKREDWGEIYDPKTQTWEALSPTTFDLTIQKSVVPGKLVMGGKVHDVYGLYLLLEKDNCWVEIEKVMCKTWVSEGVLKWCDAKENMWWSKVMGLEGLPKLPNRHSVAISSDETKRVKVWWTSVKDPCGHCRRSQIGECKTEIWCAQVLFERPSRKELWGFVEWSKNVFTLDGCDSPFNFFLHSAIVTH